jgi:hypothetical protein
MKPYGVPRVLDVQWPDVADIRRFGFASHAGKFPGKSGDYHPYISGVKKARARRYWKRKARRAARISILASLQDE